MLNRLTKVGLSNQTSLLKTVTRMSQFKSREKNIMNSSVRTFATSKKDVYLNPAWVAMAEKESRGKFDVREKLIRETNEQMLVKPIYTSEDWSPPAEPELSGK
jgi:hypothetical protein